MGAQIIDGKAMAAKVREAVAADVAALKRETGVTAGLAVVIVGDDPASHVYVRNKARSTVEVGMQSFEHRLPETTSEAELLDLIARLNRDASVHGILVQLPLPGQIDSRRVIEAIDPDKDVDGFHPVNVGRLSAGERSLVPCTPSGCIILAKSVRADLKGVEAVVVGRSNIVGKPVAQLLLREDCTVTIAHSRTRDLPAVVRRADLVIAAVGRPEMVRGDWIKPGAIVIDVGINRVEGTGGKAKLVGDVAFDEAVKTAGAITPVPGGVGPMTIACLLQNTVIAARNQIGI
ncbi:bifunctional methylenetetrahydrofolate dehydrogenase/methenyltetrahydrofolate cyclohydrolase FolD [Leptospira interrogans]